MVDISIIALSTNQLLHFFFGLSALLISAHVFGYLFARSKLPRVVGEIVGGIVLGPTLIGFLLPDAYSFLFNAFSSEGQLLALVYELGLMLLMFVAGFEIQKTFDKKDGRIIGTLIACTTIIPLVAGWLLFSVYNFSFLLGSAQNLLALQIVFATSIAVTSIPVISKIFMDLGLENTRFAKIVLGSATAHDTVLYTGLAVATGIVTAATVTTYSIGLVILTTILFFVISLTIVSRILKLVSNSRYNLLRKASRSGYLLSILFLFAAVSLFVGVNVMFGAFLAGICVGLLHEDSFKQDKASIREVGMALFIPFYFAVVGLQLDLIHNFDIPFFIAFLLVSSILQMLGTFVASLLLKLNKSSTVNLAIVMNARGGQGIVLATTAFSLGIINANFLVTLVMSAIATSLLAGWWLSKRSQNKEELITFSNPAVS